MFYAWNLLFNFEICLLFARLHLPTRDVGSLGSRVILWCIDVWFVQLHSWFLGEDSQGFVAFSKHSITENHKGREVTALVQAGLEEFLLHFAQGLPVSDECLDGASRFVIDSHCQSLAKHLVVQPTTSRCSLFSIDASRGSAQPPIFPTAASKVSSAPAFIVFFCDVVAAASSPCDEYLSVQSLLHFAQASKQYEE